MKNFQSVKRFLLLVAASLVALFCIVLIGLMLSDLNAAGNSLGEQFITTLILSFPLFLCVYLFKKSTTISVISSSKKQNLFLFILAFLISFSVVFLFPIFS